MNVKYKLDIVGDHFFDNSGKEFVVISENGRNSHGEQLYDVRYVVSGYINKKCRRIDIRKGQIKDHYSPTVAGVGCIGNAFVPNKKSIERKLYDTWKNMLYRCYNEKCKSFKTYGGAGVTVCERWLNFENFYSDAIKLPGFNEEDIVNKKVELDKDIINRKEKQYNNNTCQWVLVSENRKEGSIHRWKIERQNSNKV